MFLIVGRAPAYFAWGITGYREEIELLQETEDHRIFECLGLEGTFNAATSSTTQKKWSEK